MSFRRAAKVDSNHQEIVKAFKKLGWSVFNVSQLKNCCDLVVAKDLWTVCIEVKDGDKPQSSRRLSEGEKKFRDEWNGSWMLVQSVEDVELLDKTRKNLSMIDTL